MAESCIVPLMLPEELTSRAAELLENCRSSGQTIATAESCTGGLIAACLTETAGSSDVFERGFVTYSNEAKSQMLGVPPELIEAHGAVSRQVALAMAEGALSSSNATVSVAVTGIAGPGGGTKEKPVGLVHIAAKRNGQEAHHRQCNFGLRTRQDIRKLTVLEAFALIKHTLKI